jgi:hypothetical protein
VWRPCSGCCHGLPSLGMRATLSVLALSLPAAADWLPTCALSPTAHEPTNWMTHDLGACKAVRREAPNELWMPCSALRRLWTSCASSPKAAVSFCAVVSSERLSCRCESIDVGSYPKRVSCLALCLTFSAA